MNATLRQAGSMEQLRRHNRHLVLRSVYAGAAKTRAELAVVTGLTKPTVSTLVGELLAEGLISELGPGRSGESGGKRPTLLRFEPGARQVIGISAVGQRVLGVLSDLAGETTALHVRELGPGDNPIDDGGAALHDVVAGLLPQLDAPLLGIGAGLPGAVPNAVPSIGIAASLERRFGVGVHLGNQAELSALGQLAYADGVDQGGTLVNLIVDGGVEMGVAMAGGVHYGSDLRGLVISTPAGAATLSELFAWEAVKRRVTDVLAAAETTSTGPDELGAPSYLRLREAARRSRQAQALIDELARGLAPVLVWLVAALRPSQVSLGGRLSDLGQPFLELWRHHASALLPEAQLAPVTLSLAYSDQLGAMGAVALAIQAELELLRP